MPRRPTNLSAARKWLRANREWLGADHEPVVVQLVSLAETMDNELIRDGRVLAATAGAYRMAYRTLMEYKPLGQRQRERIESEADSLMSPAEWTQGLAL